MSVEALSLFTCRYEAWVLNRYVIKAIKTEPKVTWASLCKGMTLFIAIFSGLSLVVPFQTRQLPSGGVSFFTTIAYNMVFANGETGHNQGRIGTTCDFLSSLFKVAFTTSRWSVTEDAFPRLIIFNFSLCGNSKSRLWGHPMVKTLSICFISSLLTNGDTLRTRLSTS